MNHQMNNLLDNFSAARDSLPILYLRTKSYSYHGVAPFVSEHLPYFFVVKKRCQDPKQSLENHGSLLTIHLDM
jgi:hypothetical protein